MRIGTVVKAGLDRNHAVEQRRLTQVHGGRLPRCSLCYVPPPFTTVPSSTHHRPRPPLGMYPRRAHYLRCKANRLRFR
jgi:hypothetical protein